MEVLRAKIAKRIAMQQNLETENELRQSLFNSEAAAKTTGPNRLNMDKTSRKEVMKMLQDNKLKLGQTRQELLNDRNKEKKLVTRVTEDFVLKSTIFDRLASGVPGTIGENDILS
jgi:hypothetical protein